MDSLVEQASPALQDSQPPQAVPPAAILRQLRRGAAAIALCMLLGAAGAYLYARSLPKSYTASAAVAVEGERFAITELQGALSANNAPDPMPMVHTEVQALSSRELVQLVATQLHLDRDPEFNAALRPPSFADRAKSWLKSLLPQGKTEAAPDGDQDALIGAVMHALVISQDNRSLVIGIAFTAHDPKVAAGFVNALVGDYIGGRAERRSAANAGASAAIMGRIDQVRTDIAHIEQQMRDLREKSGLVALRAGSVGQQQLEDLTMAASRATLDRSQIEANYERAASVASGGSSDALASVLGSETISRLREQESTAASKVADLSQRYGSNYPALRSAEADLAAARREIAGETHRIVASLATQLRVARAHESDVQAQLGAARHAGVASQNVQAQLDQLQQDATTQRELYRKLLEGVQQTVTQPKGEETPDVRVLSRAVPPGLPSAPNMKMAAGFGGLGGALLACMGVLAFTRTGERATAAAFARQAGLQVASTLPARAVRVGLCDRLLSDAGGPEGDALRLARTRLGQISRVPPRVVGFIGAQPGPAAASLACAYARTAAHDGQRILLLDGDTDGVGLARSMGAQGGRIGEVLAGGLDWRDGIVADRVAGLDTLLGALSPARQDSAPTDTRMTVALENLLAEARQEYDQIVLGAPSAAQGNAVPVLRSADVSVLVVDERALQQAPAAATVARLRSLSRSPLAAILLQA